MEGTECRHGMFPLWCATCREGWKTPKIRSAKKAREDALARGASKTAAQRRAAIIDTCPCGHAKYKEHMVCQACASDTQRENEAIIAAWESEVDTRGLERGSNYRIIGELKAAATGAHGANAMMTRTTSRLHADGPYLARTVRE